VFRSADEALNELKVKAPSLYINIYVVARKHNVDLRHMSWNEFIEFINGKMGQHVADLVEKVIVDNIDVGQKQQYG